MEQFIELLNTTGVLCEREIHGFSPQITGDCDCQCTNCEGGWGACECNCDCADD